MTEKEKLFENLIEKSGKSKDEISSMVSDKVNELSGLVSEEGAIYIVANELGVRLEAEKPKREVEFVKMDKIVEPKVPISIEVKVLKKYNKIEFTSAKGNQGSVQSLLVGDETGICRVTFWNDQTEEAEKINEGDYLRILNAYTRENNQNTSRIDVHYGQYSDLEINPEGLVIKTQEFTPTQIEFTEKQITDITEGNKNVKISATVTDFDIPRFYIACPSCFKKVMNDEGVFQCAEHGEVEAVKVPIINLILDDSTGTIPAVGFRDRAEKITSLSSEEIIALTEDIEKYRNFSKRLIGSKVDVVGNATLNSMTGELQMFVNQILEVELKELEEVAKDLIGESKSEKKEKKDISESIDDDLDMEIEEIDLDDDLL